MFEPILTAFSQTAFSQRHIIPITLSSGREAEGIMTVDHPSSHELAETIYMSNGDIHLVIRRKVE
jgi:hypothetical protein